MNARSLHRMALRKQVIQGGSHAQSTLYRQRQGCPRACREFDPKTHRPSRSQQKVQGEPFAACALRSRGTIDLDLRRLSAPEKRARLRNPAQGALGHLAGIRRTATRRQSRLGGRLAQSVAQKKATPGDRFALGSLLWGSERGSQRDLPLASQGWHQQLPRLRQRLRGVQRSTLYRRVDAVRTWRSHERRGAAAIDTGTPSERSALSFAARSRVLQYR